MTERIAWLDGKTLDANQNTFGILGTIKSWLRQLKTDPAKVRAFIDEAMSSDSNESLLAFVTASTGVTFYENEDEDGRY